MEKPLENLRIAVTRPGDQGKPLAEKLQALGAEALLFPTIEITPFEDKSKCLELFDQLDQTDFLIFISRNAVRHSAPDINTRWPTLPESLTIIAIGHGTAEELETYGIQADLIPPTAKSEALLELIELKDVAKKQITIVRGDNGRDLLANTLKERQATVHYAETYHRHCPTANIDSLFKKPLDLIVTTSGEGLQNLYNMTPEALHEQLLACQLLVVSEHMADLAEELGFSHACIVAHGASDGSIIKALL